MHQIHQHQLSIDCNSKTIGIEVQNSVGDLMRKELYPKLEILFDNYSVDDYSSSITTLEINLPVLSHKNWKTEFVKHSLLQIEDFLKNNSTVDIKNNQHFDAPIALLTVRQNAVSLFLDYLKTGFYNKNSLFNDFLEIEKQLVNSFNDKVFLAGFTNNIIDYFVQYPTSIVRYLYNVTDNFRKKIAQQSIEFTAIKLNNVLKTINSEKEIVGYFNQQKKWIEFLEWSLYLFENNSLSANQFSTYFKEIAITSFEVDTKKVFELFDAILTKIETKSTNPDELILNFITAVSPTFDKEQILNKRIISLQSNIINDNLETVSFDKKANAIPNQKEDLISKNNKIDSDANSTGERENEINQALNNDPTAGIEKALNSKEVFDTENSEYINQIYTRFDLGDLQSTNQTGQNTKNENQIAENQEKENQEIQQYTRFDLENLQSTDKKEQTTNNDNKIAENQQKEQEKLKEYTRFDLSNSKSTDNIEREKRKVLLPDAIYIENTGLVILHPFLIHLFEALKWCENEKWKSIKCQHKAILLSQYLITGSTKIFENDIILNKIICGLAIESVVDTTLKLTKKETNEADNMLKAVIEYWKILKDTSINGLRETFLQRKAKMTIKQDESIELWVEQKGVDVLLTSIPWGIAMVKTPWMQFFIQCNWNL